MDREGVETRLESKGPERRYGRVSVVLPAGVITFGLFMLMQSLVAVEYFEPADQTRYILEPYIDVPDAEEERRPETVKPIRMDDLNPPPSTPPLITTVVNTALPEGLYQGTPPAEYGEPDLGRLKPERVVSVIDRNLQPITPPTVSYPIRAMEEGLAGECDVSLSVTPKGEPFNVRADCTDRGFVKAAEKAIKKVRFAPKIEHGRALIVTGVVYPIVFEIKP